MKAWQIGSPSIASPMYVPREPRPIMCCLCINRLKCAGNWSQGPFCLFINRVCIVDKEQHEVSLILVHNHTYSRTKYVWPLQPSPGPNSLQKWSFSSLECHDITNPERSSYRPPVVDRESCLPSIPIDKNRSHRPNSGKCPCSLPWPLCHVRHQQLKNDPATEESVLLHTKNQCPCQTRPPSRAHPQFALAPFPIRKMGAGCVQSRPIGAWTGSCWWWQHKKQ